MGCLIRGMEKYLEPKVKENKGNQKKRYDEIRIENSEGTKLKLKSNNKNYNLNNKENSLIELEKKLLFREKTLKQNEEDFEKEKKEYNEQKEKDKMILDGERKKDLDNLEQEKEKINLERTTLIKIKSDNEEKEKEMKNKEELLNKQNEEIIKLRQELEEKENKLNEKEKELEMKDTELKNNSDDKNKEIIEKEKKINEKVKELNEHEKKLKEFEKKLKEEKEPILIGLNNIGATCYMNASLQCFSNTKKLTQYLLEHFQKAPAKIISNEYYEVLKNLWNRDNNNKSYSPNSFKDILGKENPLFAGIAANDSKDLINFLLERFHQDLNIVNNSVNNINDLNDNQADQTNEQLMLKLFLDEFGHKFNSIISNLFYGILETKTQCQGCNIIKFNFQVYSFIEFPLQQVNQYFYNKGKRPLLTADGKNPDVNIYECFEYNTKIDLMAGDNQMFCNQCNKLCNAYYSTILYSGPTYLIINLNRGKGAVYECNVIFPEQLILYNFITFKDGITVYELYAVICHLGPSSMSGHFVAYCRNRIDNKWYLYNDAIVSLCTREKQYTDGMPYILFYKAQKPGQPSDY